MSEQTTRNSWLAFSKFINSFQWPKLRDKIVNRKRLYDKVFEKDSKAASLNILQ